MSTIDKSIQLKGGRVLAYSEYGDPLGQPIFFFHGSNDSRLEAAILHETAQQKGVRLIAPDRPGYGRSDPQPGRTILDFADDVAQLADHHSISSFGVMGHSAGAPFALNVAYALPSRLRTVTLVSTVTPPESSNKGMHPLFRTVNFFVKHSAKMHRRVTQQSVNQIRSTPEKFFAQWKRVSKADGQLFESQPDLKTLIAGEMVEAAYQGIDGMLHEHPLYSKPWGITWHEIRLPVHIWHGLADPQAPPVGSKYLVEHLPHAIPHFVPDEGHFSTLVNCQTEILESTVNAEETE